MKFTVPSEGCMCFYRHTKKSGRIGGGVTATFANARIRELLKEGWTIETDSDIGLVLKRGRAQARHIFTVW